MQPSIRKRASPFGGGTQRPRVRLATPRRAYTQRVEIPFQELRPARSSTLASGSLACPRCDAPVHLAGPTGAAATLGCPFCDHAAPLRDFLTLGEPARPARVTVRVVSRPRG